MADITTFVNGSEGSSSAWQGTLDAVQSLGSAVLTNLTTIREATLDSFQRRVSAINSKLYQSNKLPDPNTIAVFSVSDFTVVDQADTTATVRVDASSATLSEQTVEVDAVIKTVNFSTSVGTIETLDSNYNLYRVYNTNNTTPTGTFNIVLRSSLNLSVMVFDLAAFASDPNIQVLTSNTGVTYTEVSSYSLSGYRLVTYLVPTDVLYIKLIITPVIADNLGGGLYTFGLTDFSASATVFRLLSEFVTKPILTNPSSVNVQLNGTIDPNLVYFLSINEGNYIEYSEGSILSLPNSSQITVANITVNSSGLLSTTLNSPVDLGDISGLGIDIHKVVYLNTLTVIDQSTGLGLPIIRGVTNATANITDITSPYISIVNTSLYYIPYVSGDSSKQFTISYVYGQDTLPVRLKVQLSSQDTNSSPIFNGASLLKA